MRGLLMAFLAFDGPGGLFAPAGPTRPRTTETMAKTTAKTV